MNTLREMIMTTVATWDMTVLNDMIEFIDHMVMAVISPTKRNKVNTLTSKNLNGNTFSYNSSVEEFSSRKERHNALMDLTQNKESFLIAFNGAYTHHFKSNALTIREISTRYNDFHTMVNEAIETKTEKSLMATITTKYRPATRK